MDTPSCTDCQSPMEIGFVPDHYAKIDVAQWHPGNPDEKTMMGHVKMDKSNLKPIKVYRCSACGILKFYAP